MSWRWRSGGRRRCSMRSGRRVSGRGGCGRCMCSRCRGSVRSRRRCGCGGRCRSRGGMRGSCGVRRCRCRSCRRGGSCGWRCGCSRSMRSRRGGSWSSRRRSRSRRRGGCDGRVGAWREVECDYERGAGFHPPDGVYIPRLIYARHIVVINGYRSAAQRCRRGIGRSRREN